MDSDRHLAVSHAGHTYLHLAIYLQVSLPNGPIGSPGAPKWVYNCNCLRTPMPCRFSNCHWTAPKPNAIVCTLYLYPHVTPNAAASVHTLQSHRTHQPPPSPPLPASARLPSMRLPSSTRTAPMVLV